MRVLIVIALLGGCSGLIGEQAQGTPESEGERMFASTVQPLLRDRCVACHEGGGAGPAFLGAAGPSDDYSALLTNGSVVGSLDTSAPIVNKGSHSGVTWWSPDQQTTIGNWLQAEASDHGPGDLGTDPMAAWAACLTVQNWNDARMGEWADKRTEQGATCGGCHASGEYGFYANPTSDVMFAQQRTQTGIGSFFQVSAAGTVPSIAPALDKLRNKCAGGNLHPSCAVDDVYADYLKRFAALTRATQAAGLCGEPGYKLLTDPL